jgi:hypothetical protein
MLADEFGYRRDRFQDDNSVVYRSRTGFAGGWGKIRKNREFIKKGGSRRDEGFRRRKRIET